MAHIVILGAGTGGMPAAYELREKLDKTHRITVVNAVDYFQFVPSNPWLAVGWRDREAITFPIRPYLEKKGIEFVAQRVARIDAEGNALELQDGSTLAYDYLVITTGPKLSFDEVPGAGPEGHTQSICTGRPRREGLRAATSSFLNDPGPAIIGAMPGASCFGPAYEFSFIFNTDLKRRKLRNKVPITYVTSEPYIGHLGLGGVGDSQVDAGERVPQQRHQVDHATPRSPRSRPARCSSPSSTNTGAVKKEHELPFKYSMMLPAFKGVDAVAAVEGLCNPRGFVLIDEFQRSKKYRNIFSAGVCVAIPPVEATPVATGAPKTGYMIETMVTAIVHNIAAELAGQPADTKAHLERHLPGRHGRHRRGLRGAAADPAAQRQLVQEGQVGAPGEDRLREVLHVQDEERQFRAGVREVRAQADGHPQARVLNPNTRSKTCRTPPPATAT